MGCCSSSKKKKGKNECSLCNRDAVRGAFCVLHACSAGNCHGMVFSRILGGNYYNLCIQCDHSIPPNNIFPRELLYSKIDVTTSAKRENAKRKTIEEMEE